MKNIILIIALTLSCVFGAEAQMHVNTNTGAIDADFNTLTTTNGIAIRPIIGNTNNPLLVYNTNGAVAFMVDSNGAVTATVARSSFMGAQAAQVTTNAPVKPKINC